jgi:hypothetical protein
MLAPLCPRFTVVCSCKQRGAVSRCFAAWLDFPLDLKGRREAAEQMGHRADQLLVRGAFDAWRHRAHGRKATSVRLAHVGRLADR